MHALKHSSAEPSHWIDFKARWCGPKLGFKFYFDISDVQDINVGNNTIRNVLQDSKAQVYGIILLYMSHSFRNMDFCHLANCRRNVYGVHLGWINK